MDAACASCSSSPFAPLCARSPTEPCPLAVRERAGVSADRRAGAEGGEDLALSWWTAVVTDCHIAVVFLPQHKSSLRTVAVRYRRRVLTVRTPDVFRLIYAMLDPMVRGKQLLLGS